MLLVENKCVEPCRCQEDTDSGVGRVDQQRQERQSKIELLVAKHLYNRALPSLSPSQKPKVTHKERIQSFARLEFLKKHPYCEPATSLT